MTYQYPQALYLLLFIPLLIIIYFIKINRIEYYTPTYFLWAQIAKQTRPKSRWQQVFRNLTLLLQLLIVIALVLALAKPRFAGEIDPQQPIVLVVDNSASMGAKEGEGTRLEQAKELALKLLNAWGNRQVMLASTVSGDEQLLPLTNNQAELAAYIKRLPATDGVDDFPRLIPHLLARCPKPPLVYIISDGASPGMAQLLNTYEGLNLISVGQGSDNLAIVRLETRRNHLSPESYQVMVQVSNYSSRARRINLETSLGDKLLDARQIALAAGEQADIMVDGQGDEGGIIRSRLLVEDALEVDNQAQAILRPRRNISLLMVNVSNKHLQQALGVMDRLRIIPLSKRDYQQLAIDQPYTRYDMGVFYGFMPQLALSWHNLIINPGGSPIKIGARLSWDRSHPIMDYLDLSQVRINRAHSLKLYPQSQVLLQAGKVPLLVYDAQQRFSLLRLGFALEDSDFSLRPSFPMFLVNVLNFFSTQPIPRKLIKLRVGEPYLAPLAPEQLTEDKTGHVITPQGDKIPIRLYKGEDNYYRPLRAGEYQFILDGSSSSFIVSLAEAESRITPYNAPSSHIAGGGIWGWLAGYAQGWHILALLALGVVILEWWYQREKVDALY